jgi:hypothetical protein
MVRGGDERSPVSGRVGGRGLGGQGVYESPFRCFQLRQSINNTLLFRRELESTEEIPLLDMLEGEDGVRPVVIPARAGSGRSVAVRKLGEGGVSRTLIKRRVLGHV